MLQTEHRVGVEQVRCAVTAPLVLTAGPQPLVRTDGAVFGIGVVVARLVLGGDLANADAAELRLGAREVLRDHLLREPHGLEDLRPRVGRHRGDAHL